MAAGRAGQHSAQAAEERAERRTAGGGEETPGVHEPDPQAGRGALALRGEGEGQSGRPVPKRRRPGPR